MKELEYISCNFCGQDNAEFICSYDGVRIVKCKNCGLIYRNPRIKENQIKKFYNTNYYGSYYNRGLDQKISQARTRLFKKVLSELRNKTKGRRLLDVGCGQGHFLNMAKENGWEVQGVEFAESACRYARENFGLEIINKELKDANFASGYFDAVTLWNVLDHLLDPLGTLCEIYRVLKPKGILVIRIPNVCLHLFMRKIFSLLLFSLRSNKFRGPFVIHNYGFNNKTIKNILQKGYFREVKVYNSPLSHGDPYKSFKIFEDFTINILKSTYFIFVQFVYYLSLGKYTMGISLLVWARK